MTSLKKVLPNDCVLTSNANAAYKLVLCRPRPIWHTYCTSISLFQACMKICNFKIGGSETLRTPSGLLMKLTELCRMYRRHLWSKVERDLMEQELYIVYVLPSGDCKDTNVGRSTRYTAAQVERWRR